MKRLAPSSLLRRAASAGRVAAHLSKAAAKRAVRASVDDDRALGDALVAELDRMKGLAMKVGQILSYMDVGLPDETAAALAKLQRGVEPLPADVIRGLVAHALGAEVDALFERFDDAPVAAASIGQVHRARAGGREVAVKVQYPGIEDALRTDLDHLTPLASLAGSVTAVDGRALVAELRAKMLGECDYVAEARALVDAAGRVADVPDVDVPEVVPALCGPTVITTAWCDGESLQDLLVAPQARRDAVATTLVRWSWGMALTHGVLHADPHPGNFLFPGGARVVVLDWGCVRALDARERETFRALVRAVITGDRASFPAAIHAAGLAPDPARFDMDAGWAMQRWMFAPYLTPRFRFDAAWWALGRQWTGPTAPNQRTQGFPPAWIWLMRQVWGQHAVLTRLGAEGAFRELVLPLLTSSSG